MYPTVITFLQYIHLAFFLWNWMLFCLKHQKHKTWCFGPKKSYSKFNFKTHQGIRGSPKNRGPQAIVYLAYGLRRLCVQNQVISLLESFKCVCSGPNRLLTRSLFFVFKLKFLQTLMLFAKLNILSIISATVISVQYNLMME